MEDWEYTEIEFALAMLLTAATAFFAAWNW